MSKLKLKKGFNVYYLLVFTIIVLTITIQTIIQFSLDKQRHDLLRINIAGRQRMLVQSILSDVYACRYASCDYGKLRLSMNQLANAHISLQKGNEAIGIKALADESIQANFNILSPHLAYILDKSDDFNQLTVIPLDQFTDEVERFLEVMETITSQFQKSSENDIKTLMIIELELAVFSLLILIFEIYFFINPSIKKIRIQNKKLKEISWHQTHAFESHMKNIRNFNRVLKIEKNIAHKEELISFLIEELNDLEEVSKNMVKSLEKHT